jgi:transforming growth factor-beta-induced protein
MKSRKLFLPVLSAVAFATMAYAAFAAHPQPRKDIVDTAVGAGSFETLVTAVKAAGLVEALKGEGPLTVFAPTDEAFAALPEGTLDALLKDREALGRILKYHVVPGRVLAKDAVKLDAAETLAGERVRIDASSSGVKINQARVVKTDVLASNGVIHVIDKVLLPPPEKMSAREATMDLIRHAIRRGAPLYNHGQHESCAAIYEVTAKSLMHFAADEMPTSVRSSLSEAMSRAENEHDASRRAWILRHGLDAVYHAMSADTR